MAIWSIDIETDGLDEMQCNLIGCGVYNGQTKQFRFLTDPLAIQEFFKQHAEDQFVYHYGAFDIKVLARTLGYLPIKNYWFDTRLAASILPDRPKELKLEHIAAKYLSIPNWKEGEFVKTAGDQAVEDVAAYCRTDCEVTYALCADLYHRLDSLGLIAWFNTFYMPLARVTVGAEFNGCELDQEAAQAFAEETKLSCQTQTDKLMTEYAVYIDEYKKDHKTFKFNSAPAMKWLLTEKLGVSCIGPTGKVSTEKEVLKLYEDAHPFIGDLLALRSDQSLASHLTSWCDLAKFDGRIRTHYNLDIARTGRLSSSDPINLQNVRRGRARTLFVAPRGHKLAIMDLGQVEPRILADLSQDPWLLDVFRSENDFYSSLAKEALGLDATPNEIKATMKHIRQTFKTIGLSIIYGIGAKKLARYLTMGLGEKWSYKRSSAVRDGLLGRLTEVQRYRGDLFAFHHANGYLENLFGRRLYMPEQDLFHKGINTVVQSSASDLCCWGQIKLDKALTEADIPYKLILLVHDEAVYEVPNGYEDQFAELAIRECQESFGLSVKTPIELSFGQNWSAK